MIYYDSYGLSGCKITRATKQTTLLHKHRHIRQQVTYNKHAVTRTTANKTYEDNNTERHQKTKTTTTPHNKQSRQKRSNQTK